MLDDQKKEEKLGTPELPEQALKEEKSTGYYSYGPFKSADLEKTQHQQATTDIDQALLNKEGEVIQSSMVSISNPYETTKDQKQKPRKTRTFQGGMVAGFLVGTIIVGGLMFGSDKANLFSNGPLLAVDSQLTASMNEQVMNRQTTNNSLSNTNQQNTTNLAVDIVRPNSIAEIFDNASPAVVKIEAYTKVKGSSQQNNSFLDDPFFRQFFEDNSPSTPNNDANTGTLRQTGMGTGFLFEKSGYILTNEHVINGADEILVTVEGYDKPFIAQLLGNSFELDLAALKIENDRDFSVLPLANTDTANVGDWVVAIGNPYGFEHTVTVGVISAKERPISITDKNGTRDYEHLLQTDASINPGNSGGPLLNLFGEVIGINTAVNSQAQGIGFAIPTSTISSVLDNLKNNVKIPKTPSPYIGVSLQEIDQSWVNDLKLDNTEGALINGIERKSPAFIAGLRPYDVIVDVDGKKIKNSSQLVELIKSYKTADKIKIGIIRDGKRIEVNVEIGDRNASNS